MFNLIPWKKRHNGNLKVQADRGPGDVPMNRIRDEFDMLMERFFENSFAGQWPSLNMWDWSRGSWNIELEDRGSEYLFQAEGPGFEPDDFDVKISGNTLTVRAETKEAKNGREGSSYRYGQYSQTVTLPKGVNVDEIKARYHSGVIEVHLPKRGDAQAKRIEVRVDA